MENLNFCFCPALASPCTVHCARPSEIDWARAKRCEHDRFWFQFWFNPKFYSFCVILSLLSKTNITYCLYQCWKKFWRINDIWMGFSCHYLGLWNPKSKFCVKLNAIHQQNSKDGNLCIVLKYVRKQLRRFCLSIDNKQLRSYLHRRIKKKIYLKKMWLA